MKQMSRFPNARGFEQWLEMELVKSLDEEKKHLVSYNQWDSSLAIFRSLDLKIGKREFGGRQGDSSSQALQPASIRQKSW